MALIEFTQTTARAAAFLVVLTTASAIADESQATDQAAKPKDDVRILTTGLFDKGIEFEAIWSRMHETMQKGIGGREVARTGFEKAKAGIVAAGMELLSFDVPKEPEFFETDRRKYVVVEAKVASASENSAVARTMIWIGAQEKGNQQWKYVQASGMKSADLRSNAFPDFPEGKEFPAESTVRGTREQILGTEKETAP